MTDARRATADDADALAASLAAAFDDDPVMAWLWPSEATRRRRLPRFFATELRKVHLRNDEVWTDPARRGAALWAPPDRWRLGTMAQLRMAPTMLRLLHVRLAEVSRGFGTIEAVHPTEPHWYLAILGAAPQHQGSGLGSALLRPVLDRCDAEGVGAYLESSKERNLPFYARHGFEVTKQLAIPGGPTLWTMWRDPRP